MRLIFVSLCLAVSFSSASWGQFRQDNPKYFPFEANVVSISSPTVQDNKGGEVTQGRNGAQKVFLGQINNEGPLVDLKSISGTTPKSNAGFLFIPRDDKCLFANVTESTNDPNEDVKSESSWSEYFWLPGIPDKTQPFPFPMMLDPNAIPKIDVYINIEFTPNSNPLNWYVSGRVELGRADEPNDVVVLRWRPEIQPDGSPKIKVTQEVTGQADVVTYLLPVVNPSGGDKFFGVFTVDPTPLMQNPLEHWIVDSRIVNNVSKTTQNTNVKHRIDAVMHHTKGWK